MRPGSLVAKTTHELIHSVSLQKDGEDMSEFKAEELLKNKIIEKKKRSSQVLNRRYTVKKDKIGREENANDVETFKDCILSGSTSSYLRAVLLIGESDSHYFLSIFEPEEQLLTLDEIIGTLTNHNQQVLPLKEHRVVYEVKMNQIRKHIEEEMKFFHLTNITLANIHHDYVRYFGESRSLEEVMAFHILHNGTEELQKVIRRL